MTNWNLITYLCTQAQNHLCKAQFTSGQHICNALHEILAYGDPTIQTILNHMISYCMCTLGYFHGKYNVPIILLYQAPCEAEAQCAALVKADLVYATATEDMDSLTYGSSVMLRHLTASEAK